MVANNELPIPSGAQADAASIEVLRAWVVNRGLQVSLQEVFHNPGVWGVMLVDIARHAARALAAEKVCSESEALKQIRAMFDAEWGHPTDPGSTAPMKSN